MLHQKAKADKVEVSSDEDDDKEDLSHHGRHYIMTVSNRFTRVEKAIYQVREDNKEAGEEI